MRTGSRKYSKNPPTQNDTLAYQVCEREITHSPSPAYSKNATSTHKVIHTHTTAKYTSNEKRLKKTILSTVYSFLPVCASQCWDRRTFRSTVETNRWQSFVSILYTAHINIQSYTISPIEHLLLSVDAYAAVCQCGFNESKKRESENMEERERARVWVCIVKTSLCVSMYR